MGSLGYLGLVWADSVKQFSHMLIMIVLISVQVGMRGTMLGQGTLWILLAGLGAGVVTWITAWALDNALVVGWGHDLTLLVVAGGTGLAFYLLILAWVRLPELVTVGTWVWQRLGRA